MMHAESFTWSDSICIKTAGRELDLHNCFCFRSVTYDVAARSVKLIRERWNDDSVEKTLPKFIEISMTDVDFFRAHPRNPEQPFTEDDCLSSFGYDCDDWAHGPIWSDDTPDAAWRWSFAFQSGAEIIAGGASASVTLRST